jgi:hypothetical protein
MDSRVVSGLESRPRSTGRLKVPVLQLPPKIMGIAMLPRHLIRVSPFGLVCGFYQSKHKHTFMIIVTPKVTKPVLRVKPAPRPRA